MPTPAPTPCRKPGCPNLTPDGYCPTHAKQAATQRNQDRDLQRASASARGYDAKWRIARAHYLASNPICAGFGKAKASCLQPANVVDHVIPHKGDFVLFWDMANWQPLCPTCHNRKTATEDSTFAATPENARWQALPAGRGHM
jgi:5-methylcytosine-specific restriction protein A